MVKPSSLSPKDIYESMSATIEINQIQKEFDDFITLLFNKIQKFDISETFDEKTIDKIMSLKINAFELKNNRFNESNENIGLGILLHIMGISQERFKNIIFAYHDDLNNLFNHKNVTVKKIMNNEKAKKILVNIIYQGSDIDAIKKILIGSQLDLRRLNLKRNNKVTKVFKNNFHLRKEIEDLYTSRLDNKKGYFIEDKLGTIVKEEGFEYESGTLEELEDLFERSAPDVQKRNPKIDLIIPSKKNPKILVESTYQLTTSSGQTKKVDANDSLFRAIEKYNHDFEKDIIFVNFIDGGGWKKRGQAEINRLVSSCHYAINDEKKNLFKDIVRYYMNKDK